MKVRNPTDGYLRTLLEQRGIQARGVKMTRATMIRLLQDLGLEVVDPPKLTRSVKYADR